MAATIRTYMADGVQVCLSLPDLGNLRDTELLQGDAGTLSSGKILKSNAVPGTWNDDNLGVGSEANVKLDTAYGLSQTGTLAGTVPAPGAFTATARIWGSGKVRIDWTPSTYAASYTIKRNGTNIATGVVGTTFYLDTGLSAASYTYRVVAVNTTGSTNCTADAVISAELTDTEAAAWLAFKTVMEEDAGIIATFSSNLYFSQIEVPAAYPAFRAYPLIVDPNTDRLTLVVGVKALTDDTDDTASSDLMDYSLVIREAVDTISSLEPYNVTAGDVKSATWDEETTETYQEVTMVANG